MPIQTAHNGGRTQCDACGSPGLRTFPFINLLKWGTRGTYINQPLPITTPPFTELDANGYPTTISNGGMTWEFYMPTQAERPGNYVILADGEGTVAVTFTNTLVSGSLTASGGSLRYVCTPGSTPPNVSIRITARGGSDYIKNLRICHVDDEALLAAGEVFHPDYIALIKDELSHGVVRNLDGMYGNTSNITQWADRMPTDYITYHQHFKSSYWAGTTGGTSTAYTVAKSGFTLQDKATVSVRWHVSGVPNGANNYYMTATLNVQGTGAKPILSVIGSNLFYGAITAIGQISTLVYDADLDGYMLFEGSVPGVNYTNNGFEVGWPPELLIRLAAEIGAHPWFEIPYMAVGTLSDYVAGLCAMVHDYIVDNNIPWMIPRFEGPNEQWNPGFWVLNYSIAKALAKWGAGSGADDMYNWYIATIGAIVSAEWGGDESKYHVTGGVQTYNGSVPSNRFGSNGKNVTVGGGPSALTYMTHVALANYWDYSISYDPPQGGAAIEIALAADYAAATTDAQREAITDQYCQTWDNLTGAVYLARFQGIIDYAGANGVGVECYEGGFSADYDVYGAQRDALRKAAKLHWRTGLYAQRIFDWLVARGVEFPSHFNLTGFKVWSLVEDSLYGERTPSAKQIANCNHHKRTLYVAL